MRNSRNLSYISRWPHRIRMRKCKGSLSVGALYRRRARRPHDETPRLHSLGTFAEASAILVVGRARHGVDLASACVARPDRWPRPAATRLVSSARDQRLLTSTLFDLFFSSLFLASGCLVLTVRACRSASPWRPTKRFSFLKRKSETLLGVSKSCSR